MVRILRSTGKNEEFYIKAEEYSKDFATILQPIKEQKDALEHIVRAYAVILKEKDKDEHSQNYIEGELSKAKGHIYRAYYDTADIFTIVLRERISDYLSPFNYKQILSVWQEYEEERKFLVEANRDIAKLRIKKGSFKEKSSERNSSDKKVMYDEYSRIIEHLLDIYKKVIMDIYPSLASKYSKEIRG